MADLLTEADRFRTWANDAYPPQLARGGEWECEYDSWPSFYAAVLQFVADRSFASWSTDELQAVLYAIARDNEMQYLAREIRKRHPGLLLPLAHTAIREGDRENRWQLAVELGELGIVAEQALLEMVRDQQEYVRRRALEALARIGSPSVEELALAMWHRPDADQEHTRMMVLHCLHLVGSAMLNPLLAEAVRDERQYLRGFAQDFNAITPA